MGLFAKCVWRYPRVFLGYCSLKPFLIIKDVSHIKFQKQEPISVSELTEEVLVCPTTVFRNPNERSPEVGKLSAGMRVQILEFVGDFAHIVNPENGFILLNQQIPMKESKPTMLPTIECLVREGISAKDLATACDHCGALPKKVTIQLVNNRRVGFIRFEAHDDALLVLTRGLTHRNEQMLIKWCPDYLREIAI